MDAGVKDAIEAAGATLQYLPQYSPDLNPIEMPFSKFKAFQSRGMSKLLQTCRLCVHMTGICSNVRDDYSRSSAPQPRARRANGTTTITTYSLMVRGRAAHQSYDCETILAAVFLDKPADAMRQRFWNPETREAAMAAFAKSWRRE